LLADGIHVVTAAHCVADISTDGVHTTLTPRTGLSAGIHTATTDVNIPVSRVHINPLTAYVFPNDAANFNILFYDLAILDLSPPAPADAEGYDIDYSDEAIANRAPVTLAGWGYGGFPGGNVVGGRRRAATNTVSGVITRITDTHTGQSKNMP